ncbi:DNA-binding protein WhiA [Aequitasia blattaphilus]|uniref:Probable cell division protein WhiA n=1 Tax=Aequitasia blattaphilus TaxID=2949332 RepID=A0ABT1ECS4_9FIRM|nr:DNA-binding protein WhiA [Aequitasia blattaphilus]MCP1103640.1 DNA-binding protein WhiA [Aequitasia blattaphilus]MCR8616280.1 DNA-binding protein WhiA [Aequitasia blattaphilus]
MSFSGEIKKELIDQYPKARHCALAELLALSDFSEEGKEDKNSAYYFRFESDNLELSTKCFTIIRKTFNIIADAMVRRYSNHEGSSYYIESDRDEMLAIKKAALQSDCCKRAYIRGAFLSGGSVSDPNKSYHFEIVCKSIELAEKTKQIINSFQVDSKIVSRKRNYVVYLKEGSQIVDILNVMGAHVALMELENVRILKEMRNSINRQVNCETANLEKTVQAAVKQIEDITYIRDTIGLDKIPEGLRDVANTRLSLPDASLKELGESLRNPVGKSGVNHRLRKISHLADELRNKQQGGRK